MPKIDITELDKEIRQNNFRSVYVIVGAEHYLAQGALRQIREAIIAQNGSDLAVKTFSGKETRVEEVIDSIRTVPLLGGRPLALIRDADGLSKNALEALALYAEAPVKTATLVLVAEKLDGRSKLMQLATKTGAVIECKPLYMDKVPLWINMEVKRRDRQISQESARFLADMVGGDLGPLAEAIERIILYIGDKKIIDVADVEEAIAETHQHDVFELTDAVGNKNWQKALSLLHNILENGESPVLVLNMLARHFRILSKAKDVAGRMSDGAEIARYLGVHPYFAKNYLAQAKNFSGKELKTSFSLLHRCDRELKSSRLDKERIIERVMFEMIRKV